MRNFCVFAWQIVLTTYDMLLKEFSPAGRKKCRPPKMLSKVQW
jgi:hypothetical protein